MCAQMTADFFSCAALHSKRNNARTFGQVIDAVLFQAANGAPACPKMNERRLIVVGPEVECSAIEGGCDERGRIAVGNVALLPRAYAHDECDE